MRVVGGLINTIHCKPLANITGIIFGQRRDVRWMIGWPKMPNII